MFKKVQQNNWIFLLSAMQLSDVVECLIEENCKSSVLQQVFFCDKSAFCNWTSGWDFFLIIAKTLCSKETHKLKSFILHLMLTLN